MEFQDRVVDLKKYLGKYEVVVRNPVMFFLYIQASKIYNYFMDNLFKIGEIAELYHINIRTLRYYDSIDLLKPEYVDERTGYRYYGSSQFEQLNTIRYLRELQVPLEQIRDFLQYREIAGVKKILYNQIEEVEKKQHELENVKRKIRNRISQIESAQNGKKDEIEIRNISNREAVVLKYATKPDSDLEYPIRLLEKDMERATIFLGKVGLSIDRKNMENGEFSQYDYIFLLLDPEERYSGKTMVIKGGQYAVVRFNGTHRQAEENYRKLMQYISGNDYKIAGDSLEITLIDYGFTNDESQFVTEIQIPITKTERHEVVEP